MKRITTPLLLAIVVSVSLAVAACGAGSPTTSNGGTPTTSTSGPAATATVAFTAAKTVPVASTTECGKLLSLSEANQDTSPVSPATLVFGLAVSSASLCYYESATHQPNLALIFKAYSGGTLNSQSVQSAASSGGSKVQIVSTQPVSGVGNQALFVTLTGTSTLNGATVPLKENILFVVDGAVSFGIINTIYNNVDPLGSASASTVLNDFEQVAQLIISRL